MLASAVALAVVLSSFYLSRMLPELDWVKHSTSKYFSTTWDYHSNFLLYPGHFINFGDDALNLWLADLMLIAAVLLCVPTLAGLYGKRIAVSKSMVAIIALAAIAFFMTTPLSLPVWNGLGFLQKVQFPWRWMSVVTVFGSVLASAGIYASSERLKSPTATLATAGLGAVLLAAVLVDVLIVIGPVYISHTELKEQIANIPHSNGCECWWPVWAEMPALAQTERIVSPGRTAELIKWSPTDKQFSLSAGEPVQVNVATFYYPRWHAYVNGAEVPVERSESGAISLSVAAELADIRLSFQEPIYVKAAYIVSTIGWLIVICLWPILRFRTGKALLSEPL
jgi:hypothetical protein